MSMRRENARHSHPGIHLEFGAFIRPGSGDCPKAHTYPYRHAENALPRMRRCSAIRLTEAFTVYRLTGLVLFTNSNAWRRRPAERVQKRTHASADSENGPPNAV